MKNASPERLRRFPERLRRLRTDRGRSLEALAREIGVTRQTLWYWENGRSLPTPENLKRLAQSLGLADGELSQENGIAAPSENLWAALERKKAEIAGLLGTTSDKVRIMVEL